jgi:3-(3-hydroxy-phenyl)propionate hydroxylase
VTDADQFDVIVVGCSSTGLALAKSLAAAGVRVAAIDRWRLAPHFDRGTHLDDETVRLFQILGVDDMEPNYALVGAYRFYDPEWRTVMNWDMGRGITDQGWQSDYMFHQPSFEQRLRGAIFEEPTATTFFGWQMTSFAESDEGVEATLHHVKTEEETRIKGSYLVGCDGANSMVRRTMGCEQEDFQATHRSLIVDITPFVTNDKLPERDCWIQGGIQNPVTYVPCNSPIGPRLRFEELLRPTDHAAEFESLPHVYRMLTPWFKPSEYRIIRADVYEWHAVVATPWRRGRVMLAGDACHEMPPHTGQGLCSGIRDALNLSWKLQRILSGRSSPDLLESYETERRPHITVYVEVAQAMANQIEAMQQAPLPSEEELQQARDDAEEREPLRPPIGPGIVNGGDPWAGRLSAQPTLSDGRRMDDPIGFEFALVGDPSTLDEAAQSAAPRWEKLGVKVIRDSGEGVANWLEKLDAKAVLVRPDRFIFGTAKTPADVVALTARLEELI